MKINATTAQMKELDRIAIEEWKIPSLELMEHAATKVTDCVMEIISISEKEKPKIAIFCGFGNNGGDGIAAARLLKNRGCQVRAILVGMREKMTKDSLANEKRLLESDCVLEAFSEVSEELKNWLKDCDAIIDALFGVGLKRPVSGDFLRAVQMINQSACPVVACDIPSGIDGDTGEILGEAVRADRTVTFSCGKPGLYQRDGAVCAGIIEVVDIGIPEKLMSEFFKSAQ